MMSTWVGTGQKFDFFVRKSWFFCKGKHFRQNIMTPCYFCFGLLIAIIYFRGENKKKKCWNKSLIKSTVNYIYILWTILFYLLIFPQN